MAHEIFEIRIKAIDHRLADEATRSGIRLARQHGSTVRGPLPLPVIRGRLERDEARPLSTLHQLRTALFRRILKVSRVSEDGMTALSNLVLPAGVQSRIKVI